MKTTASKSFLSVAASVLFVAHAGAVADMSVGEFAPRDPQTEWNFIVAPKQTLSISEQINLYQFVLNNPISNIDPLGLSTVRITTASGTQTLVDATPAQVRAAIAATADGSITEIEIQGHGNAHFISMGAGGTKAGLTDIVPGKVVYTDEPNSYADGTSFGETLLKKLAPKGKATLNGCNTARTHLLTKDDNITLSLSKQLADHPVSGLRGFGAANEISNPFNRDQFLRLGKENHSIGIHRTYINGK